MARATLLLENSGVGPLGGGSSPNGILMHLARPCAFILRLGSGRATCKLAAKSSDPLAGVLARLLGRGCNLVPLLVDPVPRGATPHSTNSAPGSCPCEETTCAADGG